MGKWRDKGDCLGPHGAFWKRSFGNKWHRWFTGGQMPFVSPKQQYQITEWSKKYAQQLNTQKCKCRLWAILQISKHCWLTVNINTSNYIFIKLLNVTVISMQQPLNNFRITLLAPVKDRLLFVGYRWIVRRKQCTYCDTHASLCRHITYCHLITHQQHFFTTIGKLWQTDKLRRFY